MSGCLLFSDPINKAPTVSISTDAGTIYRNQPAIFVATVADDHDPPSVLRVRWNAFSTKGHEHSCTWIKAATWPASSPLLSSDATYTFKPLTPDETCVCAQVVDSKGATGQACSAPITPVTPSPVPIITDDSGANSNQQRPLCSQISLSAERSTSPSGDPLQFSWTIDYSGSDPTGKSVQLAPCDGVTTNPDAHRCFAADPPGTYTVSLKAKDSPDATSTPVSATSDPFVIPINVDTPPCIRRSDPDVYAQRILLSRSSDLGSTYQSRTFKVLSVDDDCEPYPPVAGSKGATQFAWSVLDMTGPIDAGAPVWAQQTNTSDSFTVSQAQFPNARPGDTIKVRLEVRDTQVQKLYANHGTVCPDSSDICCGPSGCTGGANDCVRWTTWTVQFQP